jgi:hypothetical protein
MPRDTISPTLLKVSPETLQLSLARKAEIIFSGKESK